MRFVAPLAPDIVKDSFQHFDALAAAYDAYCLRRYKYLHSLDRFISLYANHHQLLDHLDVGCGTGRLLKFLRVKNPDLRSQGIDLSRSMVQLCTNSRLRATHCNFMNYSHKKCFDLITMEFNVFGYLSAQYGPRSILKHARLLLRPEGVLIFDLINPLCLTYDRLFNTLPLALYRYMKLKMLKKPLPVKYQPKFTNNVPRTTFALIDQKLLKELLTELNFKTSYQAMPYEFSDAYRFLPLFLRSHIIFAAISDNSQTISMR